MSSEIVYKIARIDNMSDFQRVKVENCQLRVSLREYVNEFLSLTCYNYLYSSNFAMSIINFIQRRQEASTFLTTLLFRLWQLTAPAMQGGFHCQILSVALYC